MEQKVIFDFTQGVEEMEVAVMPAHLAKKLLANYAESLSKASIDTIVGNFIDDLRASKKDGLAHTINVAREWVDERTLIHNISTNNWNAYAVEQEVEILNGLSWFIQRNQTNTSSDKEEPHAENTVGI